ncbi:hypothetical protein SDC9_112021 [bioreactor metagenome]|uniref:Uncharacterized protein n=1 Tax=bioreactor metagenome TaxID=1076179 RepID=A0A645BI29_9ZZZZ
MTALEVGHLGLVACLDKGVESSLDQGGDTTAEHSLFAKEVGLGLFLERGFKNACTSGTEALCIGEGDVA